MTKNILIILIMIINTLDVFLIFQNKYSFKSLLFLQQSVKMEPGCVKADFKNSRWRVASLIAAGYEAVFTKRCVIALSTLYLLRFDCILMNLGCS